jgi:hypothetical protein
MITLIALFLVAPLALTLIARRSTLDSATVPDLAAARARCRAAHGAARQAGLWELADRLYAETITAAAHAPSDRVRAAMFQRLGIALEVLVDRRGWACGIVTGFAPSRIIAN